MKNFCVVPWFSREINLVNGKESICCWINGTPDLDTLRNEILADQRPVSCSKCWENEDSGIESRRQMENRFLDYVLDRDLGLIKQDVVDKKHSALLYQIFLGSLCNSTCVTCGSHSSTAWQSLNNTQTSFKIETATVNTVFDQIEKTINWKTIKRIILLGGESLLIKKSFDILNKLDQAKNYNCLISFVTNGSVSLTKKQILLFRKFSNIQCCVSIDGIGKVFDYIRFPLTWNNLLINLEQYRTVFKETVVSFTISNLNYHCRNEIVDWFKKNNLLYIENYVKYPRYFDVSVTPGTVLWPEFVKQIKHQDQLKNISINDYIPEIARLIN
jgi:MoaA/NifB/PqqE/SkfB family radical SAM enzyme